MKVTNPVLRYYGSKFRLAQWIINYFPPHRHYVEPFGGAANVLLVKKPSRLETYNDLNSSIVNFFRILRQKPQELIHQIKYTPWARSEYHYCKDETDSQNPLEAARQLFYRLWMSYSGEYNASKSSWGRFNKSRKSPNPAFKEANLYAASERLLKVQIENRDAFRLIADLDSPDTLFYLDPPYIFSTRTKSTAYSHEMTNEQHRTFAELLYSVRGFVVLSGYPSPIYKELFENHGWLKVEREALVMGGGKRTECLWLSPRTAQNLGLLPVQVID